MSPQNQLISTEPHAQVPSSTRYGRVYVRRNRRASNASEAPHTIPLVSHRVTSRLRALRTRRTHFSPQIELLRTFESIALISNATTQRRATRSRRTNFSSLVPIGSHNTMCLPLSKLLASRNPCPRRDSFSVINEDREDSLMREVEVFDQNKRVVEALTRSAQRKIARDSCTSEQKAMATSINSARRSLARSTQTSEQRQVERSRNALSHRFAYSQRIGSSSHAPIANQKKTRLALSMLLASRNRRVQHVSISVRDERRASVLREVEVFEHNKRVAEALTRSAQRKIARDSRTSEQKAMATSINSARHSLARSTQTSEQRQVERSRNALSHRFAYSQRIGSSSHTPIGNQKKTRLPLSMLLASRNRRVQHVSVSVRDERRASLLREVEVFEHNKRVAETLLQSVHRKKTRSSLTSEQKAIATSSNSARRSLARSRQTLEQRQVGRSQTATNQSFAHIVRINGNDVGTLTPVQLEDVFHTTTLTNAQRFRKSCQELVWVSCQECKTRFPGMKLSGEICTTCFSEKRRNMNPHMFSVDNLMDPGVVPIELSRLSNLEQILIARIHPMMSVYRVRGQQYKYSGNVINFEQDVNAIATVLPVRPADLSAILIVKRIGTHASKEFRVRREFVRQALIWLLSNHIFYRDIVIDNGCLNGLPIDGIPEDLPHATDNDVPTHEEDFDGPPEIVEQDVYIDEFRAVGTIVVAPQPNQQTCIERVLKVANADTTTAHMPFTTKVIDEFSTPGYIAMAFPTLFPYGNADLRQARPRKLNPTEYFKYLMKFQDGRFARDSRFRYFAWNSLSRWRALALGDVYVKKNPSDGELSIQDIQHMLSSGDRQIANRISYYAKSIRGTRAYWYTRLKELTAMVKQLGPPTIFFTLSAADMQWPDLISLLDSSNELQKLPVNEQGRGRAKLLNDNPAIAAWFLQARVELFLKDFLNDEFSVIDHWYRFEWQNRGSGHVHGFLWLKDSPNVSQIATNDEVKRKVIEYFDKLVCLVNPDVNLSNPAHPCARSIPIEVDLNDDDDDYASLVNWVMRHTKCGSYCMRLHKITKHLVCRFRFPFDVLDNSQIIEEPPDSKMFRFMGRRNDPLLGSHNRQVLQTWRANIDWSPVLSVQSVVNYIAKYAAKAEPASKSFTDTLRGIVSDLRRPCQNIQSAIKRLLIRSVSERDISAQEVCHLLMGYPLTHSSRKIILLNISENNMLSTTVRRKRPDNHDDDDVGTDSGFVSRYLQRPAKYTDVTLFSMAKKHYFSSNRWHDSRADSVVRVVPELDGDITPSSERWESFCRQEVLLHHHYHSIEEAKGEFDSWSERYTNLGFLQNQLNLLPEPIDEDFEDDMQTEAGTELLQREEWMMAASMGPLFVPGDNMELGMRDFDISHNWAEGFERYPNIDIERKFVHNHLRSAQVSEHDVVNNDLVVPVENLSNEQKVALDLIIKSLQDQRPIQLVICGGAGTGKSTLINAIVNSSIIMFGNKKVVRIMAPTGVAAFNIGGATIHHELSISAERKAFQAYKHISGDQCRRMQDDFKDTKLIIIDEYSMLGRAMLANIDLRCRDIFSKNESFGGVSVVLVGDMRQLPPVFDSPLYAKNGTNMQQCGGMAYTGFGRCVRLSQIFRQAGIEQASFRQALLRLSDGTSTIDDWHLFRSRDSSLLTLEELNTFKYALRLFPTKQAANDYNCERLIELGKPIARIHSKNNCETASSAMPDDAKGLEKILYLSVGARVMLRANLSTHYGLVNGAMGTVVDIVYASGCGSPIDIPLAIMVDFDNYQGLPFRLGTNILPITPQTANWKTSSGTACQRTQLPIVLCWAITVHKSQGLTLDRVVVDIGDKESLGLTFVALSRTRKLCDLAFSPMFTFERLQKIGKCIGLKTRLEEEERLRIMSTLIMSEHG